MPKAVAKIVASNGFQMPTGAVTGYVLKSSDGAGNAAWIAEAITYFEQPADPGGSTPVGSIWVDTDAAILPAPSAIPIGTILPTAIPNTGPGSEPSGFLFCDGSAVSRSTYANLFNAIGTTYGAGDGSTTFNLPDLLGRVPLGAGTAVPAVTGGTAHTLAQKGGEEKHQLVDAELSSHTHALSGSTGSGGAHDHDVQSSGQAVQSAASGPWSGMISKNSGTSLGRTQDAAAHTHAVGTLAAATTGQDTPHNTLPPYLGVNFIVKY